MKPEFKPSNNSGFTMIEILIVLIIIGILAGLSIPIYQTATRNSYRQEALSHLGAVRESLSHYFSQNGTYVGASVALGVCNLDFCPNITAGGQTASFQYTLGNLGPATYTVSAFGTVAPILGLSVTITQAGTVGGTLMT